MPADADDAGQIHLYADSALNPRWQLRPSGTQAMRLQHILPVGGRETVSQLPAPYQGPEGFLLRADVHSEADFRALLSALLKEVDSDWPTDWNAVIDQLCDDELGEKWRKIELVLGVFDTTPFLYFFEPADRSVSHRAASPHWTVKLSVWTP